MRWSRQILLLSFALSLAQAGLKDKNFAIRQESASIPLPTLSASVNPESSNGAASESQSPSASQSSSASLLSSTSSSGITNPSATSGSSTSSYTIPSSTVPDTISSATTTVPTTSSTSANNVTSNTQEPHESLPLPPRITPALSVAGVFLILTGVTLAIIGVKNRWVHVFLSTAYLASVATLVLILYVINPPVSNAVQGAYFVGVFMTGLIFGGGAMVFKDITEGLGCLLGGFALSMWFLTLRPGGLITSTTGKGIFIGVFCVVVWSLSFSHYTRPYGLMFSTSFAGATSLVLGIDCFSRSGLKEFWVYLWALNDDLFPLNTETYPVTRGTRVEIVIIVLGTIIGLISQVRLWKVVQDRQKARAERTADAERRQDAVEEALGRHLERQNDRDRSEWERRYGNQLAAKRQTILWSNAHVENKHHSNASVTEVGSSQDSQNESSESLEMSQIQPVVARGQSYSSRSLNKRQNHVSVQPIQEVDEEEHKIAGTNAKHDSVLGESRSPNLLPVFETERFGFDNTFNATPRVETRELRKTPSKESMPEVSVTTSLKPSNSKPSARKTSDRLHQEEGNAKKRRSIPSLKELRRRSMHSLQSLSPKDGEDSPVNGTFSESKEALVMPASSINGHSRASSMAATLDEEDEKLELPMLDSETEMKRDNRPPQIVISRSHSFAFLQPSKASPREPPSPSALSESFEADPEALVRPAASNVHGFEVIAGNKRASSGRADALFEDEGGPIGASQSPSTEYLTKDVLDRVPSQASNVVLSYRTNEWAKHIAAAEAPVHEEPDPLAMADRELPTHLASPLSQAAEQSPALEFKSTPSSLPLPIVSVAPSAAGVKVNPEILPSELQRSSATTDTGTTPVERLSHAMQSTDISSTSPTLSVAPQSSQGTLNDPISRPSSSQGQLLPRSSRNAANSVQRHTNQVQNTPIDENAELYFTPRPSYPTPISTVNNHIGSSKTASNVDLSRSDSTATINQHRPTSMDRSPSIQNGQFKLNRSQPDLLQRPNSSSQVPSPYIHQAMRSETRLVGNKGTKSHQPLQRNNTNESRRENLMADWRIQLARSHNTEVVPRTGVDSRYAQQMLDYEAEKLRREQARTSKARVEVLTDQSMRTQGMIDAHKEVLRKMQSEANKKLDDKKVAQKP